MTHSRQPAIPGARIHISDAVYNAAEQQFEALVAFHLPRKTVRVAAAFAAPLSAPFTQVQAGLLADARRALATPGRLKSTLPGTEASTLSRAGGDLPRWWQSLCEQPAARQALSTG